MRAEHDGVSLVIRVQVDNHRHFCMLGVYTVQEVDCTSESLETFDGVWWGQ